MLKKKFVLLAGAGAPPARYRSMASAAFIPSIGILLFCARITFPTCRAHCLGGPTRCMRRLLPCLRSLPRSTIGSAPTSQLSRRAQASLVLRPAGSLGRPKQPLSRGFSPPNYSSRPLVSYQINRQGWILPPLVTRAFGAHDRVYGRDR